MVLIWSFGSHLNLIFVVENFEGLAVFDDLCTLLELELEKRIGHNSNSDIDGLDIVFDCRDSLLDVR